jgi:pyruvate formate lyase activating enzyme
MNKRDFLKSCFLGSCGLALAHDMFRLFPAPGLRPGSQSEGMWKWSKEAQFYDRLAEGIKCRKCPNECLLGEGESGICRNRVVWKGQLYSIAYGNPCAVHIDPVEKKPLFHFLPGTRAFSVAAAGCNFRCLNCQNWQISQFSPKETDNYDLMPKETVDECLGGKSESIAYTYSEPTTFYEYVYDTATIAKSRGIKNILKSNGYINEKPLRKLCQVLDAANIDLKIFDDGIYRKLSSGSLDPVLKTLKVLKEEGVWLEVANLVIPSWTDDIDTIKRMSGWLASNNLGSSPLHFSRFTPLYKLTQLPLTPVSKLEKAREVAMNEGMKYVYIGNVPAHDAESTFCPKCRRMIVQRRGFAILRLDISDGKCKHCNEPIAGVWKLS